MMKTTWMPHIVAAMGIIFVLATMSSIALCAPKATITPAADTDNQQDGQLRTSIYERPIQDCDRLAYFKDMKELEAYFDSLNGSSPPSYFEGGSWMMRPVPSTTGPTLGFGGDDGSIDYSQTNVQVAGIDEEDIVKTDGEYIYTVSGTEIAILKAYPPGEASLLSKITLWSNPYGLFIDGDSLIAIMGGYGTHGYYGSHGSYDVHLLLYDVSDRSAPSLMRNVSVSGSFVGSRLYEGYVYVVASFYMFSYEYRGHQGSYVLRMPELTDGTQTTKLEASQIGYFKDQPVGGDLVMVLALKTSGDEEPNVATYLVGGGQTMSVSTEHIFVAGSMYRQVTQDNVTTYVERTTIHKISFSGTDINYQCSGEVPGRLINQFTMDEYEANLRVATTGGHVSRDGNGDASNNVYVLDSSMKPIGAVEGLAPGEQLHSVRFVGDRAYLVTFKKIDPFFVVDLSHPTAPSVLGYLKIPGFSEYLHPLDENHIIGIGIDTVEGEGGNFAWFQGVKLSLFDVTDVYNPVEIAKYVIGDRGTYSEVLYNHKALLFSVERGLLALPITLAEIDWLKYPFGAPPSTHGDFVWQGVYVFSVSVGNGFVLQGRVTHGADPSGYYWYYYPENGEKSLYVERALYIEDVLYTISDAMVKMNRLTDFSEIGTVDL